MFRIDVASAAVGLPAPAAPGTGGYFTNGNPATSTASTVVDQDWLNSVQEELVAIATALGASLVKTTRNQCLTAIQGLIAVGASASAIQAQAPNYAVATGTANAIAATYTPAIAAHITGAPLRVKITLANTGATTFNPGPGAVAVKAPDGTALQANTLRIGAIVTFVYDGAAYIFQEDTSAFMAISAGSWFASNLLIQQNSGTPTTQVDVSVDQVTMMNTLGLCRTFQALSATINFGTNGAINRLDTGALANNTAYDIFAIAKADGTGQGFVGSLASNTSNNIMGATTVTTLNALGYTGGFYMRLGTVITNGSAQFRRTIQNGNKVDHIVTGVTTGYPQLIAPVAGNGNTGTPTWVASGTVRADSGVAGGCVPAKAKRIRVLGVFSSVGSTSSMIVAATAAYGALGSLTNPPPLQWVTNSTSQTNASVPAEMVLEANTLQFANSAGFANNASVNLVGWTENVNAS